MHWRHVLRVIGVLTLAIGLFMALPLVTGLIYQDGSMGAFLS